MNGLVVEGPVPDYVRECSNHSTNHHPNQGSNDAAHEIAKGPTNEGAERRSHHSTDYSVAPIRSFQHGRLLRIRPTLHYRTAAAGVNRLMVSG